MLSAAGQIHLSLSEDEEYELDIPLIHVAYSAVQARLVNFSELVQAFPNLVGKILKLRERLDVGEMVSITISFSGYHFIEQHLLIIFR